MNEKTELQIAEEFLHHAEHMLTGDETIPYALISIAASLLYIAKNVGPTNIIALDERSRFSAEEAAKAIASLVIENEGEQRSGQ